MQIAIRIPQALHAAIPEENTVSGIVRQLIAAAVANPDLLGVAFSDRVQFTVPRLPIQRYATYITEDEHTGLGHLAERFLIPANTVVQILLEDLLFRAELWPPTPTPTPTPLTP